MRKRKLRRSWFNKRLDGCIRQRIFFSNGQMTFTAQHVFVVDEPSNALVRKTKQKKNYLIQHALSDKSTPINNCASNMIYKAIKKTDVGDKCLGKWLMLNLWLNKIYIFYLFITCSYTYNSVDPAQQLTCLLVYEITHQLQVSISKSNLLMMNLEAWIQVKIKA